MEFKNRVQAGRLLAKKLAAYGDRPDVVVLALPRGGVPVGYEVARALNAPLDVFLVRKLGLPGHEEFAMGAIASGDVCVLDHALVDYLHLPDDLVDEVVAREKRELNRREKLYRGSSPPVPLSNQTVIVVDDGLATGSTMRAAVEAIKKMKPAEIVVAVPVAGREACESFKNEVDSTCVCVMRPEPFHAVGLWYQDFSQTSDEEVSRLLKDARERQRRKVA